MASVVNSIGTILSVAVLFVEYANDVFLVNVSVFIIDFLNSPFSGVGSTVLFESTSALSIMGGFLFASGCSAIAGFEVMAPSRLSVEGTYRVILAMFFFPLGKKNEIPRNTMKTDSRNKRVLKGLIIYRSF
jgi:hypothetical protein